jgi:hypothetical protein
MPREIGVGISSCQVQSKKSRSHRFRHRSLPLSLSLSLLFTGRHMQIQKGGTYLHNIMCIVLFHNRLIDYLGSASGDQIGPTNATLLYEDRPLCSIMKRRPHQARLNKTSQQKYDILIGLLKKLN